MQLPRYGGTDSMINRLVKLVMTLLGVRAIRRRRRCRSGAVTTVPKPDYPQFLGGSLDSAPYLRGNGEFIGYCERLPSGVWEYYRWDGKRNRWVFKRILPVMTSDRDVRRLCFAECSGAGKGRGK